MTLDHTAAARTGRHTNPTTTSVSPGAIGKGASRPAKALARLCLAGVLVACHVPLAILSSLLPRRRGPRQQPGRLVVVSPFEPGETSGGARAVKDFLALVNARRTATLVVVSRLGAPVPGVAGLASALTWPLSVPPQCRALFLSWRRVTRELDGADTAIFEHFSGALCLVFGRPAVRHLVIRDHEVQIRKIALERRRTGGLDAAVDALRIASCYLISRRVFAAADRIVTLTTEDRDALVAWFPFVAGRTTVIPVPFEEPALQVDARPAMPSSRDLLMIGNFFHRPNVDALRWFIDECAPHLAPGFRLHLCGLDTPLDREQLATPHLTVVRHGFVANVHDAVPQAAIAVAPVVSGGGVRIKNLLLASLGKAVVTTSLGNEGIGFVDGRDAVVTDDGLEMARRINELAESSQELVRLGAGGNAFVRSHFGHAAILERVERELFA